MRINRKMQNGLLFVLYIARGGRVTLASAAEGLFLPKNFLEQIARVLRLKGVIKSIRGPFGGYEMVGSPTVRDVLSALGSVEFLTYVEKKHHACKSQEGRAMVHYLFNLSLSMHPLLNRKITNVMNELVVNELATLDRADTHSVEN